MELIVILGIVVVVAGWYYFGKDTRKTAVNEVAQKSKAAVDEAAKKSFTTVDNVAKKSFSEATKLSSSLAQTSRGLFNRLKTGRENGRSYLDWAKGESFNGRAAAISTAEAADGFRSWLNSLSEEDIKGLQGHVGNFCTGHNFDFSWLQNPVLEENDPELKAALEDAVILFSLACWKASRVQKDVEAMLLYENWAEEPIKGRNLNLSQSLFARMVDDRKVKASPELLLAPEKERREFVVNTVKNFADSDRKSFNTMFKSVIAESGAAEPGVAVVPGASEAPAGETVISHEVVEESKPAQKRASRRTAADA